MTSSEILCIHGSPMKKLYLIDTFSYFFRAYYAIPSMSNKNNLPTNALYGLVAMLVKLIRDAQPEYMAFCYDRKEPSFRNEIYSEYKANRTEPPEDLIPQFPYVRKITEALGAINFDREGFEADDIIGSLALWATEQNKEVIIVSSDKDFAQLISEKVTMFDSMKNKVYDVNGVVEKWGVKPTQMVDYLALVGDSSDNVPGVRGVGPKKAQQLLAEYDDLDSIYDSLDGISAKALKKNLIEHKEMAYLSKRLVTIRTDLPFSVGFEDLKREEFNKESLSQIFSELEFKNFEKKLYDSTNSSSSAEKSLLRIKSSSSASAVSSVASSSSASAVSSSALQKKASELLPQKIQELTLKELADLIEPYASIWCVLSGDEVYLEYKGNPYEVKEGSLKEIGSVLSQKLLKWKGFDIKLIWKKLEIQTPLFSEWDQMLATYIVKPKNIEGFAQVYEEHTGKVALEGATGVEQIEMQKELEKVLSQKIKDQMGEDVLREIELPLVPVLYTMERNGIAIDLEELEAQSQSLSKDIKKIEKCIFKESKEEFNVASPKQLSVILFDKMKIPTAKKTKTGYSTDSSVLEGLQEIHPICRYVLEYRELAKLKSTYVDALPQLTNEKTKRIHTDFRQAATTTGRLSSVHPNLQNIPIKTARGRLVRKAFVAPKGSYLISADYSQIELRILAHITGDENLNKAFMQNKDIHQSTASEIFSVPLEKVTPEQRRIAKAVNFGIAYGQGAYGLSKTLGVSHQESSDIIAKYFKKFKGIRDYMNEVVEDARNRGYVETIFGRRRYLDEFQSSSAQIVKFAERAAINAPIQGSASDIVKRAMIKIDQNVSAKMLLQVHDELVFECEERSVEEQTQLIREIMEATTMLSVPLVVNIGLGTHWGEAH